MSPSLGPVGSRPAQVLDTLVPAGTSVFCAESDLPGALEDHHRHQAEAAAMVAATPARRAEFATGRLCARQAMRGLGEPAGSIGVGASREPIWPAGLIGSITHCRGFRAAAVARVGRLRGLGIDAEEADRPGAGADDTDLADVIGSAAELESAASVIGDQASALRLVFSAKEAVFKASFPLTAWWLEFGDVEVDFRRGSVSALGGGGPRGTFATTIRPAPGRPRVSSLALDGRWAVAGRLLLTCAVVTQPIGVRARRN